MLEAKKKVRYFLCVACPPEKELPKQARNYNQGYCKRKYSWSSRKSDC